MNQSAIEFGHDLIAHSLSNENNSLESAPQTFHDEGLYESHPQHNEVQHWVWTYN